MASPGDFFGLYAEIQATLDAIDASTDRAGAHVKAASEDTAERIASEARARVARRTGQTASHIVVEESHDGKGYVVWVEPVERIALHVNSRSGRTHTQRVTYNALGGWLEFGTRNMSARPFLFISARVEEAAHLRRTAEALTDAFTESGLGE